MSEKNYIEKIEKWASKKLKVEEVYLDKEIAQEAISYLKRQKYLEYKNIETLIKNNFISNHPIGYVLKNKNNEIVGFMGTIFSIRNYNKKDHLYCNIHTWIVENPYRIYSFLLLTPLAEKKITLTAFTPVKTLIGLLEKFGFKTVKMKYRVIFLINLFNFTKKNQFKIVNNLEHIKETLNQKDLKIFNDYYHIPCEKFVILDKTQTSNYIFIIANKAKKKKLNILNFLYISNHVEFKKNWKVIKYEISKNLNTNFLGQYFFNEEDCVIPKKKFLSKSVEKNSCVKNLLPNTKLDVLYSDLLE